MIGTVNEIKVPDIGDFKDVAIIEILVKPGDIVALNDTLIVLESDKATLDVPSPSAGIIRAVLVTVGSRVSMGTAIITLEEAGNPAAPPAEPPPKEASLPAPFGTPAIATAIEVTRVVPPVTVAPSNVAPIDPTGLLHPHASPSLRRFAREIGADLHRVTGSGPKNRILKEDVQNFVKSALTKPAASQTPAPAAGTVGGLNLIPWPQVDFAKFGPIERSPLSKIKKISGANLSRNAVIIPHVTNFDEADVTELEAFRVSVNKETGSKITILAFMIKAIVTILQKFPTFNASLDGEELILKNYYHIGFAADTPNGLVVPVIRNVDHKGIIEIATEMAALSALAREGKLKPNDMQGGCFTISSLGGIGGLGFTPIINAPELAILGAARAQMKPVWDGQQFQPRLYMPLSLSWDHRVIDGAAAARFLVAFTTLLADFRRIIL